MATAVWTGFISFGIISVPVKLYAAARSEGTSFNQVHKCASGSIGRVKQHNSCSVCNSALAHAEFSKGYEFSKGNFTVIEEAELKALAPEKSDVVDVTEFVKFADVDPIFFDKSYFVVPQTAGRKAYELLFQTMGTSGLAGRATLVMRGKEYNVFIRVFGKGLMIHTVFAETEVRSLSEYETTRDEITVNARELKLATALLESLIVSFDAAKLTDKYEEKVALFLETKRPGASDSKPAADLTAALAASLEKIRKAA